MLKSRSLPWDWYPGTIPDNVLFDPTAYLESTYSFLLYRSQVRDGTRVGRGASVYLATMFDVGPEGRVSVGEYALLNGVRIICDRLVEIGSHCLLSWNVLLMDTYRLPLDRMQRRAVLERLAHNEQRRLSNSEPARPIRIGPNVWIGFECCVLPGVTIGAGSIVGARSVVKEDVPPYSVAAGNPARIIRQLDPIMDG